MTETIEPFAPVMPKLLERASEPPKTIFTYFTAVKENLTNEQKFDALKPPPPPKINKRVVEEDDDIICILDTTPNKPKPGPKKRKTTPSRQDPEFTPPPSNKRKVTPKSSVQSDPEFTPPPELRELRGETTPSTSAMRTRSARRKMDT